LKIVSDLAKGIEAVPRTNVYVRQMNVAERSELVAVHQRLEKEGKQVDAPAWVLVYCCCDASGKRLFTAEQIGEVLDHAAEVVDHISEHALRFNGLDREAVEEKKST